MARCLSKEDWVVAQSIKLIGNTAIPVVKLKTQILENIDINLNYSNNNNNNDNNNSNNYNNDNNNNDNNNDNNNGTNYHAPHTSGGCLSLDISFEGPGHYGLQANKMTKTLIKVRY